MRISHSFALALALLAVPAAARAEAAPPAAPAAVQPAVTSAAVQAPQAPEMKLQEVQVKDAAQHRDAAAPSLQRGSFWWLVGVIVVAGVILAIVL